MNLPKIKSRSGAALVEMAIVLPVLIFFLMGIVETGLLISDNMVVANAAREGARAASVGKTTSNIGTWISNQMGTTKYAASTITLQKSTDGTTWTTLGDTGASNNAAGGNYLKVKVSYPHTQITNIIPGLNMAVQKEVVMQREP